METSNDKRLTALRKRIAALSPAKREILERVLKGQTATLAEDTPRTTGKVSDPVSLPQQRPAKADHHKSLPMSFAQRGMWLLQQTLPDPATYNQPAAWRLSGSVDREKVSRSLRAIMARHEALRTALVQEAGSLAQRIIPATDISLPWQELDLRPVPVDLQPMVLEERLLTEVRRPFDLAQAPLWRVAWVQLSDDEQVLAFTFHHSITDEWSWRLFFHELERLYVVGGQPERAGLPELPVQYADYAVWQRQRLTGDFLKEQRAYWQEQLRDLPTLELPADLPQPVQPSGRGAEHLFQITGPVVTQFRKLAREENTTLFTVVLTAFYVWLHRYTGQDDIVVGTPITGRERSEFQDLIGFFLNTLPVRAKLDGGRSFREVVHQVHDTLLDAFTHAALPFEEIVELAVKNRTANQQPLYRAMFVLLEKDSSELRLDQAQCRPMRLRTKTSKNDFTLSVQTEEHTWSCRLDYAADLFSTECVLRLARHLAELLESIAKDPKQLVSELRLLPEAERRQILVEWNQTEREYPRDKCVHQLFEEQADRTPDAVAVEIANHVLTYQELNIRANQLAHHLRKLKVKPEHLVGIRMERSEAMVVAILAVLKAGGAFVPMTPDLPHERLAFVMADAQMPILLTQQSLSGKMPPGTTRILSVDGLSPRPESSETIKNPECNVTSGDLAYAIYTSGSTGKPKGVLVTQEQIAQHCRCMKDYYGLRPSDRILQFAPLNFDVALETLLLPLLTGARVLLRSADVWEPALLTQKVCEHRLTVLDLTPPYWRQWLESLDSKTVTDLLKFLRLVIVGGDVMPVSGVLKWRQLGMTGVRLLNMYGPTEATISALGFEVDAHQPVLHAKSSVPLGRPLPNRRAYVLDAERCLLPVGVPGELYLGGEGIARGYLNCPELTAERFVPDPFSHKPKARLYRTGDKARWLPDGNLEFLGRIDHQLKIRGFRIELGEIEALLGEHPEIAACAVVARDHNGGERQLTAFVVKRNSSPLLADSLRRWLTQKLPGYMIPTRFAQIPALPLTSGGKVDRKTLETFNGGELTADTDYVAPRDERERQLVESWQAVLGRERVGVQDNFFDLGGHSLLAMALSSKIKERLGVEVSLRWIFQFPTIEALAGQMASEDRKSGVGHIEVADRRQPLPMSFSQQGMWLLQQTLSDPATYNQPVAWRFLGPIDRERVRRSLQEIMVRHEVLRTALVQSNGMFAQEIAPPNALPLPWREVNLETTPPDQQALALDKHLSDEAHQPFDLARAPLWRVLHIQLSNVEHVLAFTFHHSVTDEWSFRLFFQELERLYAVGGNPESASLPALWVQYADYAVWHRRRLTGEFLERQRGYWRKQLRDLPPSLELPADSPRPRQPSGQGASHSFQITGRVPIRFRELAYEEKTTLFTVVLAAFHVWLHRYTGQDDIVVGTPITVRQRPELQALIGFFLNTLPIRVHLDGGRSFLEVVRQVRDTLLDAFSHAELPFEQMVELAVKGREANQQPLYRVMFVLLEEGLSPLRLNLAEGRPVPMSTRTSKNDFTWSVQVSDQLWDCRLEYAADLLSAEGVASMSLHLSELLESIAENPQQPVNQLRLLSEVERQQILVEWNRTEREYPRDKCVHQLFEEQAERSPDAVAVVFENDRLTYRELNERANQLAHHLRELGVGPDSLVGICMERSLEMVVGLLGIWKSGGAYVPLDPEYPPARLAFMMEDAEVAVLLTQERLVRSFPLTKAQLIRMDMDWPGAAEENFGNPVSLTNAEHLAYMIYTSGTTGHPKGAMIPHRAIANHMYWIQEAFPLDVRDSVLQKTPITFDASIWEFWAPLCAGARLVLARPGGHTDTNYLVETIVEQGITVVQLVPSLLRMLLENADFKACRSLRRVFCGGETLTGELAQKFYDVLEADLINLYGPTEATIDSVFYALPRDRRPTVVPIGRPVANTRAYVLGRHFQPVPIGVPGELYLGGPQVGRGYHKRPELTKEKFVASPFSKKREERLYKTGDLVRWLPDGCLEFLGRTDHQVKIRGYRIELSEIEAALTAHPAIKQAVVLAREDNPGDQRLVAYVVTQEGSAPAADLRELLRSRLPAYMVPAAFVILEALPLTPNGKIDRRALPKPDSSRSDAGQTFVAPRDPVEEVMAQIFQEVLKVERVSVEDNFFELGGHSLLATQVSSRVRQTLEVDLPLRLLFEFPTVAGLASSLLSLAAKRADLEKRAELLLKVAKLSESEAEVLLSGD